MINTEFIPASFAEIGANMTPEKIYHQGPGCGCGGHLEIVEEDGQYFRMEDGMNYMDVGYGALGAGATVLGDSLIDWLIPSTVEESTGNYIKGAGEVILGGVAQYFGYENEAIARGGQAMTDIGWYNIFNQLFGGAIRDGLAGVASPFESNDSNAGDGGDNTQNSLSSTGTSTSGCSGRVL